MTESAERLYVTAAVKYFEWPVFLFSVGEIYELLGCPKIDVHKLSAELVT